MLDGNFARWIHEFEIPAFVPHRFLRGGHLQTLLGARPGDALRPFEASHRRHIIPLSDGDALAMHDDEPAGWTPRNGSVLMIHGICGCHAAPYMVRFQRRLGQLGIRTFRLDMRGCGDSAALCRSITHAGRSEDVLAAIEFIASVVNDSASPIGAVGVSLGGNQLLLTAGRVGNGVHAAPSGWDRVGPILAIAPPLDLQRCSDAMQSARLRFYNWYFIKHLLRRASPQLRSREDYQEMLRQPRPRTLRQFDRKITAPLAGFESETDYYGQSSAASVVGDIAVPTLIVTSSDDPLVPVESFSPYLAGTDGVGRHDAKSRGVEDGGRPVRLHVSNGGGHHGFLKRDRTSWSDDLVSAFFAGAFAARSGG
ncbi:YheT family hydrolase [Aporhodopirellula aestuarii]|uniref:Alpha/beta fold hydrolase n=1 Tax=Aporhodopirellula aestuarii TaxID=2950107 RepID=A0ABT0U9V3_9BACT|nr:alpha/beta fold hydrolase [Aporhodopirellula aestuarii]MCM2373767.1 alpha/beta fold hydrolase [Aporhodopirellula aestuarii]